MMKQRYAKWLGALAGALLLASSLPAHTQAQSGAEFGGIVFEDLNVNGLRDADEQGIAGVAVSNGREVAQTGTDGAYTLPLYDEMVVFAVKPAGYAFPLDENNKPEFYYVHQPDGSPDFIAEYDGLVPTGDLPASVDFALTKVDEPDTFTALILGDTQVTNSAELDYLRDDIVAELTDTDALLALMMGDNVNDNLALYDRYLSIMSAIGLPMYFVPGNHDMNYDSPDAQYEYDTFKRVFGPTYYSFNYGQVHFVILSDVIWDGEAYHGELGAQQLEWLANDLAQVPQDALIVLNMHIPLASWQDRTSTQHAVADRDQMFALLEGRNAIALAGHTHTLERFMPGEEIEAWGGSLPIQQIVVGAACGSWWSGDKDERGIPISYQRDAAPNGYMLFHFDGNQFSEQYIPADSAVSDDMILSFDSRLGQNTSQDVVTPGELSSTTLVANIFSGSRDSVVEYRIDDNPTAPMVRNNNVADPYVMSQTASLEDWLYPLSSTHIWTAALPTDLTPGAHTITVSTTDVYGQSFESVKVFEVWATE
ncbi:calcineurin-like phosphoesterase C-terminal domain-containing protein [Aggregatilinea lenta]|uniref:calcineurin-like phosphoesterase C-terminal domain-containing protein n=1 Tax=Aggregatilinea lenta TaxID=913108 RepID=UPI0013C2DC43|nr:calcineurin-like phosphoesterase family protein [Aggregatilinea lenta]